MPLLGRLSTGKNGEVKEIASKCQVPFQSQVKAETMLNRVLFTYLVCKFKTESFVQSEQTILHTVVVLTSRRIIFHF